MAHKMNVESFNLDHTKVAAPFVRVADVKHLPAGDVLTRYDVRFCQPNREHLEMPAVHSLEHSFAECVRNHSESVIDFGPMGCQTGFYLIMVGEPDVPATCELVETTLRDILKLDTTPLEPAGSVTVSFVSKPTTASTPGWPSCPSLTL